jgi:transposase
MMNPSRKPYPSDVSDEEWSLVVPYLTLLPLDAKQREYDLREVGGALRWWVRSGAQWEFIPHDFPPWRVIYEQTRRWIENHCFENIVHDLREILRLQRSKQAQPSRAVLDSGVMQSTPESGHRARYNGHKRRKGTKVHIGVDTLGQLLALSSTPANEDDRKQGAALAEAIQVLTGQRVEIAYAYVDQGYTGPEAEAAAAQEQGIRLEVVKKPGASKGFVLLPKRWVVERSFAWTSRFRRLARDYERLTQTLEG